MSQTKAQPVKPKPPLKGKLRDWRLGIDWLADIATQPRIDPTLILERNSRHHALCSFPELFSRAPKFPDRLDFGSPNIRALWCALGLFDPETVDAASHAWTNSADLTASRGFMLEEPGSRIYGVWHLAAHLAGYHAARLYSLTNLQAYFSSWLQLWWTLQALSLIPTSTGPRSLYCGARSQGAFGILHTDYALSLALALPWQWQRGVNNYWRKSPEIQIFDAYRNEIALSSSHIRDNSNPNGYATWLASCPQYPSIIETHYLRTSSGLAVWIDDTSQAQSFDDVRNANTPGIAALGHDARYGFWSLPDASRDHVRQRAVFEQVTTIFDGGRPISLSYVQSGAGRHLTDLQELPSGDVIYYIRHGREGIKEVTA